MDNNNDKTTPAPVENNEEGNENKGGVLSVLGNIFASKEAREAISETAQLKEAAEETARQLEAAAAEFDTVKGERDSALEQVEQLQAKLAELQGYISEKDAKISELDSLKTKEEVSTAAARVAAENHVDIRDLAPSDSADEDTTPRDERELELALEACETHAERSALVKQYRNRANN
jgi:uncharacterized coiled-coil DUF342 family protein